MSAMVPAAAGTAISEFIAPTGKNLLMKNKNTIYHIVTLHDLTTRTENNYYKPFSFESDGFIHCTAGKSASLLVLEDYFTEIAKSNEIMILEIDTAGLKSEVRYEPPAPIPGGGTRHLEKEILFPHIYGCLNIDAVAGVGKVDRIDGRFVWPSEFSNIRLYLGSC